MHMRGKQKNSFIERLVENSVKFKSSLDLLKRLGASNHYFLISIVSSMIISSLGALSVGLIVPLAKGILEDDFSFLLHVGAIERFIGIFSFVDTSDNIHLLGFFLGIIFGVLIVRTILAYVSGTYLTKMRLRVETAARTYIFDHYIQYSQSYFDQSDKGKDVFNLMRLPKQLSQLLQSFDQSLQFLIQVGTSVVLMFIIWWQVALIGSLLIFVMGMCNKFLFNHMRKKIEDEEEETVGIPSFIQGFVNRASLTKIHNKEQYERKQYEKVCRQYERKKYDLTKMRMMIQPTQEVISILTVLLFVVLLSFISYSTGSVGISRSIAVFVIFRGLSNRAKGIVKLKTDFARIDVSLKKISGMRKIIKESSVKGGLRKFSSLEKGINFDTVSFGYGDVPVIKNASFFIPAHKITCIVGKSGHGKSTLVKLLLRFYDFKEGKILFDDFDLRTFNIKSLRSKMGYVSQKPVLFNDTLWNNIMYGVNRYASKKEVKELLIDLGLSEMLKRIDGDFEKMIGDEGNSFSGGEKQRICIARALLKGFDILLLDEATSALDVENEKRVLELLREKYANKTIILISHRVSTIKHSDKTIVMKNGRVHLEGKTHDVVRDVDGLIALLKED